MPASTASLAARDAVVDSLRASLTGAVNDSAGHRNRRREPSALSNAGWNSLGRPNTWSARTATFAERAENWKSASHTGMTVRSSIGIAMGSRPSLHADRRRRSSISDLRQDEQDAVRAKGVWPHPPAGGSRSRGWAGAARFVLVDTRCFLSSGTRAAHRAKPRPGCTLLRRGLAARCGARGEGERRRGASRDATPRSCSDRGRLESRGTARPRARALELPSPSRETS